MSWSNHQEINCLFKRWLWLNAKKTMSGIYWLLLESQIARFMWPTWGHERCYWGSLSRCVGAGVGGGWDMMKAPLCDGAIMNKDNPDVKVYGANMGLTGPRWVPCWPHELCYLGCLCTVLSMKHAWKLLPCCFISSNSESMWLIYPCFYDCFTSDVC